MVGPHRKKLTSSAILDIVKKKYITSWHGIDLNQLAACTLVFEGSRDVVQQQQAKIYQIAKKHSGVKADAENGKR